jgi:hypothetical protein
VRGGSAGAGPGVQQFGGDGASGGADRRRLLLRSYSREKSLQSTEKETTAPQSPLPLKFDPG